MTKQQHIVAQIRNNTWRGGTHSCPKILLSLLLVLLSVGCSPQETLLIGDAVLKEVVKKEVVALERAYSSVESFVSQDIIDIVLAAAYTQSIEFSTLSYYTVDPKGRPVVCIGLVCYPTDCRPRGIVEMATIAREAGDDRQSATDDPFAPEIIPSLFGYITLIPDLIGKGNHSNTTHLMRPFCMVDNNGRVAYDFRKAAAAFLAQEHDYHMPPETMLFGYSYGATSVLAAAKYYQEHDPSISIEKIVVGGGAYDLEIAFTAYAQDNYSDYVLIPQIIMALDYWYDLHLDYTQLFTGKLLEDDYYKYWENGGAPPTPANEYLGTCISDYMHPDFFKPVEEQNPEFQKLHTILKLNSHINGWCPNAPTYLFHSLNDHHVPFACTQFAYNQFKQKGANVKLFTSEKGHEDYGIEWFANLAVYLFLK